MPLTRSFISTEEMSKTFNNALNNGNLVNDDDTALIFYDLSFLTERIDDLIKIFPETALHAVAVKANPLTKILQHIKGLNTGLEAASSTELYLAEKAGFPSGKIVFDSPVKTKKEIEYALKLGVHLNADSFEELDRINEIIQHIKSDSTIGVRLNPQVGAGSIRSTSVGDSVSKFGIPVNENAEKIKNCFEKYPWLKGAHVHIGSQGCPIPLLVSGIRKIMDITEEINKTLNGRIEFFDIGGGLPVSYHHDRETVSMEEYHGMLKEKVPELFGGRYRIITEFGRYIYANTGWVASKVEYVKHEKDHNIIMTHVGADLLLRKCYNPDDWHHQITVADKNGKLKTGKDRNKYIVAGPLCFAGDIVDTDLELPVVETGDYLLIHDTGAYTISMWSRYNSRQMPKVIGYNSKMEFHIIKDREEKEDIYKFWG